MPSAAFLLEAGAPTALLLIHGGQEEKQAEKLREIGALDREAGQAGRESLVGFPCGCRSARRRRPARAGLGSGRWLAPRWGRSQVGPNSLFSLLLRFFFFEIFV